MMESEKFFPSENLDTEKKKTEKENITVEEEKKYKEQTAHKLINKEVGWLERMPNKTKMIAKVMILCTALAAYEGTLPKSASGESVETHRYTVQEYQQRLEEGKYSQDDIIQRKIERLKKKKAEEKEKYEKAIQRAQELAKEMGVEFDPNNYDVYLEGFVPTIIQGKEVPLKLLTKEERKSVENARKIKQFIGNAYQEENQKEHKDQKKSSSDIIESSDYMSPDDL